MNLIFSTHTAQNGAEQDGSGPGKVVLAPAGGARGGEDLSGAEGPEGSDKAAAAEES